MDAIRGGIDLGKAVIDYVGEAFSNFGEKIMNVINIGATFFSDMFSSAIEGVKAVPGMIADAFMGLGSLISDKISGAFDSIGETFKGIGKTLLNLLPDIDFGEFAGNFAQSVKNALSTVTNFIKKPFNFIIRTFNRIKNAISGKVLFKGYTLISKGFIADNDIFGTIPGDDISIPKITTPTLMGDVPELHAGGRVEETGLSMVKKGEIYAGAGDAAFKPISDEIHSLKNDIGETNRILMRIINEGLSVHA